MTALVHLVATTGFLHAHASERCQLADARIGSADFTLNPNDCTHPLGRWLAQRIGTTRFGDDGARCVLVLPETAFDQHLRDLLSQLGARREIRDREAADLVFAQLEGWVREGRAFVQAFAEQAFSYRLTDFEWPVLGTSRTEGVVTAAQYFDTCAAEIRRSGGIVLRAGRDATPPPREVLRTLAGKAGGGERLLTRYLQSIGAAPPGASADRQLAA